MLTGARLALCVAELTSSTRAGLMLSSPDKSFFAPVCAVMAARQIFPCFSSPRSSLLHRGDAALPGKRFPCAATAATGIPSYPGPLGTCHHKGFFFQQAGWMHSPGRACRTVVVRAGTGSPHPAPFGVVESVLSVLPRSQFVLQLNNAWTCSLTPEMISKRI